MEFELVVQELTKLDPYEALGKRYFQKTGQRLRYEQYIYLLGRPDLEKALEEVDTPQAKQQQAEIKRIYAAASQRSMLSEADFFQEGKNIEVQKLLRYVDIPSHRHEFLECSYVFTGRCLHVVDGHEHIQQAGDFISMPYGIPHALYPEEDCLCLTIKVRTKTLLALDVPDLVYYAHAVSYKCTGDLIPHIIFAIYEQQEAALKNSDRLIEQLFQILLLYLSQRFGDTRQLLTTSRIQDKKIIDVLAYVMENYQTVTLKDVAEKFHYNESYFSSLFHRQTGQTFSSALREFKLRQAAMLLKEGNAGLEDICEAIGYQDTTQFSKSFKKIYGMSPREFRRQSQAESGKPIDQ